MAPRPPDVDLAALRRRPDSPPVRSFFFLSAFYCDQGLLSFAVQSVVDAWVRLRHGPDSATSRKIALTCLVRQVSAQLRHPSTEQRQEALEVLELALQEYPEELCAPVWSLLGSYRLFQTVPPDPRAALTAFERAMELLPHSSYLCVMSRPHHLFFGAAMAATLLRDRARAEDYLQRYEAVVAKAPRKRWGAEVEADLRHRIAALPKSRLR